ncbi:hypothetical protein Athai_17080 [Actinocatenispora thailandica]|uniref:Uncharacterized protein n=1 Tax=Actinocatenispora thailandica TaxID=227318 RepID=A0A7R7DMD9_9ACTN|nr:hypothetical protein [Actinocatenispora thailandica]BCJ34205.1 hypothetical protein Athai_17080 [Actinocatenispora thailandica]
MSIRCQTCQHPDLDHFDGVCWHSSPEDHCCEIPDLGTPQCRCEDYRPPSAPPADPNPAPGRAVCVVPRPTGGRPLPGPLSRPRSARPAGAPARHRVERPGAAENRQGPDRRFPVHPGR